MTNTPKSNLARTNKTFLKQNSFLADFGFFFHGKARTNPLGVSLDWSIRSVAYLINEIWRLHIRAKRTPRLYRNLSFLSCFRQARF